MDRHDDLSGHLDDIMYFRDDSDVAAPAPAPRTLGTAKTGGQAVPWTEVTTDYVFDGPDGPVRLSEMFAGRRQLIVKHLPFSPELIRGCDGCNFHDEYLMGSLTRANQQDVSNITVSSAPIAEIEAFRQRMGWRNAWVSSSRNEFNAAFDASFSHTWARESLGRLGSFRRPCMEELSGMSVLIRDQNDTIFHTFSTFALPATGRVDPFIRAWPQAQPATTRLR